MNRVCDSKPTKGISLELQKVITTVIHGTTDTAVFPTRMFQVCEFLKFRANLLG